MCFSFVEGKEEKGEQVSTVAGRTVFTTLRRKLYRKFTVGKVQIAQRHLLYFSSTSLLLAVHSK